MDQIQASATFPEIAPDDLEAFRQLAAEALAAARAESGTIQYDWFYSDDNTHCVVRETYADSDAVLAHLANVGPLLGRLVALGGGLKLEVYGDPSPTLRDAVAAFQPLTFSFSQGK